MSGGLRVFEEHFGVFKKPFRKLALKNALKPVCDTRYISVRLKYRENRDIRISQKVFLYLFVGAFYLQMYAHAQTAHAL